MGLFRAGKTCVLSIFSSTGGQPGFCLWGPSYPGYPRADESELTSLSPEAALIAPQNPSRVVGLKVAQENGAFPAVPRDFEVLFIGYSLTDQGSEKPRTWNPP